MLKCPFCLNFTVLESYSIETMTKNSKLAELVEDSYKTITNCDCGELACKECITCQVFLCKICIFHHFSHVLIEIADNCQIHNVENCFFCEEDLMALCEICATDHLSSKHTILHKNDITVKYWHTLTDLSANKAELKVLLSLVPFTNSEIYSETIQNFEKILQNTPKT